MGGIKKDKGRKGCDAKKGGGGQTDTLAQHASRPTVGLDTVACYAQREALDNISPAPLPKVRGGRNRGRLRTLGGRTVLQCAMPLAARLARAPAVGAVLVDVALAGGLRAGPADCKRGPKWAHEGLKRAPKGGFT
eukprot:2397283-Pyramimonas_sp.AAC.1